MQTGSAGKRVWAGWFWDCCCWAASLRMGVDSLAVLIVYFGGVFMLYRIA
ncbi:MAG: hypothetical protein M3496_09110 [Pseudomonadota bacterium]|nr:hypothetical protein [Pseudomonadota bacterium]